jgi:hypothetical protein
MALTDPYGDLATFKARAGITGAGNDAVLLQVLSEASRQIEKWTGRNFNQSAPGTVRYFKSGGSGTLFIDDLVSVSAIATDDGQRTYPYSWIGTDYDLEPYEAPDIAQPYTRIVVAPYGRYSFGGSPRGVRITGVWGWPAVPDDIAGACYLQATRLWKRKEAPFGVTGSADMGQLRLLPGMDQDVKALVDAYKKPVSF